ncbi:glucokinase [Antarcticimicrobium luteum]|nr:glucokinase [Antarcticimicrobium luteum]
MTVLLADMGGTASRLALLRGDGGLQCAVRWRNDNYAGPGPLLARYLRDCGAPPLRAACIAVAGPVAPGAVRWTNRDWAFERGEMAALLRLPGAAALRVVNDLTALALALPGLGAAQLETLRAPVPEASGNGQALVANCGTGFNVGLVRATPAGPVAWEAELGHAALPVTVAAELGAMAGAFASIEALFSGAGLARLHASRHGGEHTAQQLVEAAGTDPAARGSVAQMARSMGLLARELVAAYLPRDGVFWAGSMARGVLGTDARADFLGALAAPGPLAQTRAAIPVAVITDDAAALGGLAALAAALP